MLLNEGFDYPHLDRNANAGHTSEGDTGIPVTLDLTDIPETSGSKTTMSQDSAFGRSESGLNGDLSRHKSRNFHAKITIWGPKTDDVLWE